MIDLMYGKKWWKNIINNEIIYEILLHFSIIKLLKLLKFSPE